MKRYFLNVGAPFNEDSPLVGGHWTPRARRDAASRRAQCARRELLRLPRRTRDTRTRPCSCEGGRPRRFSGSGRLNRCSPPSSPRNPCTRRRRAFARRSTRASPPRESCLLPLSSTERTVSKASSPRAVPPAASRRRWTPCASCLETRVARTPRSLVPPPRARGLTASVREGVGAPPSRL